MAKILVVDDEESVRRVLSIQTKRMGHETLEAENGAVAWSILQNQNIDTVITDLKMPEMDGLELLSLVRKHQPQVPVIMITAHGTIDTAVEAMKRGAFDYITKPFNQDEFLKTVERAIATAATNAKEFHRSRAFLRQEERIIGSTEEMQNIYSLVERVANSTSNILITGEPGTGKEAIVRLLHDKSERRLAPLVTAHLLACPADEQPDQIFGTESKPGWFELAEQGTLYFDEIGALDMGVQAQVFDALTSGRFIRGSKEVPIQCRIIAVSDYNLLEKIERGSFRKDLFYMLNVVPIHIPALRDRTQDIEPLVDHFIKTFSKKFKKNVTGLNDEALFHLIQYSWPGNIRELENCIEYAVNVADKPLLSTKDLPSHIFTSTTSRQKWQGSAEQDVLRIRMEGLEKRAIEEALSSVQGDLLKASQKLGVPPSLLENKIASLKISSSH